MERIGKWWWKETEIDIVGIESKSNRALAIEAKLTELNCQEARRLLFELGTKANQIHDVKECILGVMAKKVENKEKIRSEGFIVFDLQDMANLRRHES